MASSTFPKVSKRAKMAIRLRYEEKELLTEAIKAFKDVEASMLKKEGKTKEEL